MLIEFDSSFNSSPEKLSFKLSLFCLLSDVILKDNSHGDYGISIMIGKLAQLNRSSRHLIGAFFNQMRIEFAFVELRKLIELFSVSCVKRQACRSHVHAFRLLCSRAKWKCLTTLKAEDDNERKLIDTNRTDGEERRMKDARE